MPLSVLLVIVSVPRSTTAPPMVDIPLMRLNPESAAVTPAFTLNRLTLLPPLRVTPAAGPVMVVDPAASLSVNTLPRLMVCGMAKTIESKVMACVPAPRVLA